MLDGRRSVREHPSRARASRDVSCVRGTRGGMGNACCLRTRLSGESNLSPSRCSGVSHWVRLRAHSHHQVATHRLARSRPARVALPERHQTADSVVVKVVARSTAPEAARARPGWAVAPAAQARRVEQMPAFPTAESAVRPERPAGAAAPREREALVELPAHRRSSRLVGSTSGPSIRKPRAGGAALISQIDYFTPGWMLGATFDHQGVCNDTKPGAVLAGKVPVIVAYVSAGNVKRDHQLCDCNVSGCAGGDLCKVGAQFITQDWTKIVNAYRSYSQGFAACYGTTRPIVFEMEPDWYQYTGSSQTQPWTRGSGRAIHVATRCCSQDQPAQRSLLDGRVTLGRSRQWW